MLHDNVAQFGHNFSTTKKSTTSRATLSGNNVAQFGKALTSQFQIPDFGNNPVVKRFMRGVF